MFKVGIINSVFAHGEDEDDEQRCEPSCHQTLRQTPNTLQEPRFISILTTVFLSGSSCLPFILLKMDGVVGSVVINLCCAPAQVFFSVCTKFPIWNEVNGAPAALSVPGRGNCSPFFQLVAGQH